MTEQAWSMKDLLYGEKENFLWEDQCRKSQAAKIEYSHLQVQTYNNYTHCINYQVSITTAQNVSSLQQMLMYMYRIIHLLGPCTACSSVQVVV